MIEFFENLNLWHVFAFVTVLIMAFYAVELFRDKHENPQVRAIKAWSVAGFALTIVLALSSNKIINVSGLVVWIASFYILIYGTKKDLHISKNKSQESGELLRLIKINPRYRRLVNYNIKEVAGDGKTTSEEMDKIIHLSLQQIREYRNAKKSLNK